MFTYLFPIMRTVPIKIHIRNYIGLFLCLSLSRWTLVTCLNALSINPSFEINLDFCLAGGHIQICQPGQQTCPQGKLNEGKNACDGACFCTGMQV